MMNYGISLISDMLAHKDINFSACECNTILIYDSMEYTKFINDVAPEKVKHMVCIDLSLGDNF